MVCTQFEIRVPYMRIGRGTVRTRHDRSRHGNDTWYHDQEPCTRYNDPAPCLLG